MRVNPVEEVDISWYHEKVHDSKAFFANRYATGLSNGASYDTLMVTSTGLVHLRVDAATLGGGSLAIYEGATTSNNGTSITAYNRDRASADVGTATVFHTPTVSGTGTLLFTSLMVGAGGKTMDSINNGDYELILKVSTKYLFRFTSTAGSNAYTLVWNWYEGI